MNRRRAAAGLLLFTLVAGCNSKPAGTTTSSQKEVVQEAAVPARSEFNTTDKSILTNQNMAAAAVRLKDEAAGSCFSKSQPISAVKITKSPYSLLGKMVRMTGKVYKVEELPPDPSREGSWGEILMLVPNQNAPMAVSTIDFIYNGDISHINSGQRLTCSGYFIGTFESENAMGGKVEAVVLVGNSVKM